MRCEHLADGAALLVAFAAISRAVHVHRRARELHAPADYEASPAGADPWRWRRPPPGLRVVDAPGRSTLHLDPSLTRQRLAGVLAGLLFACLGALVVYRLATLGYGHDLWVVLPLAILPWSVLHLGSRVVRIELEPDALRVVVRYGGLFHRLQRLRPGQRVYVDGRVQSALGMETGQRAPEFVLNIGRRRLGLRIGRRYMLPVDQTAGTWIVGGLQAWIAEASPR